MIELDTHSADDLIVIGTSTGGLEALRTVLAELPPRLPAAIIVVMHVGQHDSLLPSLLARITPLPLRHARTGDLLEPGRVLIAPPDHHVLVRRQGGERRVVLSRGPRENHARPAIDPTLRTAAAEYGARAIGVILTGQLDDGTAGLYAIKACGGQAIVQLPDEAVAPDMPASAIEKVEVDKVLHLREIAPALVRIVAQATDPAGAHPAPPWLQVENDFIGVGGNMEQLASIAAPSVYTCPECHGTLWEVNVGGPKRYRCHTGHSLSERSLSEMQNRLVEDSIWSAIRALHEKERLLRQMAEDALAGGHLQVATARLEEAAQVQRSSETLRRMVSCTAPAEQPRQEQDA